MGSRSQGFTLVEMLMALALIGLLSVMLFEGVRFGGRTVATADARFDRAAELSIAFGFLQNAIGNAQPAKSVFAEPGEDMQFAGSPDQLAFVTLSPAQVALGGFQRLSLQLEASAGGRRLVVAWKTLHRSDKDTPSDDLAPSVLVDKLAAAEFAYYGTPDEGNSPQWETEWNSATALPLLVRLRLTFADGSRAPELIVAPAAARANDD
jgi:general secretion pathway protein J